MNIKILCAQVIASVGGIGYLSRAPGTLASVITTYYLFYQVFFWSSFSAWSIVVLLFFAGVWAIAYLEKRGIEHDPAWIVIDEVCALWIGLLCVPRQPEYYLGVFILFRIFDISKWGGVAYFDKQGT